MKSGISRATAGIGCWFGIAISACSPGPPPQVNPPGVNVVTPTPSASHPSLPPPAPAVNAPPVLQPPRFIHTQRSDLTFRGIVFDSRSHRLRVVDQPNGPGSSFADVAVVGRTLGALSVVNGGFFTPEGAPLGLVVDEGTVSGTWNKASSLGSALWQEDGSGRSEIVRRSPTSRNEATTMRNLLQAGPLLIENGVPVSGLDSQKYSARTFLLWGGGHRWWLGVSSPVTLHGLARTLGDQPPVSWRPNMALNLDGGGSSQLWVSGSLGNRETHIRSPWNRAVRNFLALVPRN